MQKWSAVKERGGDVTADADAGFLPFGWALAVPSHLILCVILWYWLFSNTARQSFSAVLKEIASFCRCTVAVSG